MKEVSEIKNYTRGGQITLHNIRMFIQITNKVIWIAAIIFFIVTSLISILLISKYEWYLTRQILVGHIICFLNQKAITLFIQPDGSFIHIAYRDIIQSKLICDIVYHVEIKLFKAALAGLAVSIISMFFITAWLKKRGGNQTTDKILKGDRIASKHEIKDYIISLKSHSDLSLASVPLIKHTETAHFLFHGTTGTGKSNGIKELLDQIRLRGDRAIIYDKSCSFLQEFFQPSHDVLLNPLDERGREWDLWLECRDSADFDSLAAAQIPMPLSTQDPFWVNAARTIFSAAAYEMRNDPERSITKLLRYLLTADLDLIQHYLKGTEAETLVSEKIEKTAISIKSVLATYLKSLKYVKQGKHPFSIRQWIQNDLSKEWLFITSLGDRHETLKPLISAWLDIAVNALLSLEPDPNRRIWIILDELTSLQPLPYLTQTLSESRKFGGCIVIGIQNYAQLSKVYGYEGAKEISSLLNTRLIFRQPDPEMAKWSAQNFGEVVTDEFREGISYGANSIRDGISINRAETRKPLVSYSEIMSLTNLYAYLRLPGQFPITLIDFKYKERKKPHLSFLLRKFDESSIKEMNDLTDKVEHADLTTKSSKNLKKKSKKSEENIIHDTVLDI